MSKIRIIRGKSINLPVQLENRFDITGNEMEIQKFSDDTLQQIINPVKDYEVAKFIHDYDSSGNNDLIMAMNFLDGETWHGEYIPQGFEAGELISLSNAVKNSFFKLDFFDSPNRETQKLQFTKIIPMYLSNEVMLDTPVDGRNGYIVPDFYSNAIKNNEISDLFIFKSEKTKNIDEFYMGCRFFNAKNGDIVRMTNDAILDSGINPSKDYYYKVVIDRDYRTYQIFDYIDGVVGSITGTEDNPLMFYQML